MEKPDAVFLSPPSNTLLGDYRSFTLSGFAPLREDQI